MIWLWIVAGLVVVLLVAIRLGFMPPPHATTLIRVRGGRVEVTRGHVRTPVRDQLADLLQDAGVSQGFVAVTPSQRVCFSRRIPREIHQRLRNVVLNP